MADIPTPAAFVRYWGNNGQKWILACDGLSAYDPKRTYHSLQRGHTGHFL